MAYIDHTPYTDPDAWGRPGPGGRRRLPLGEWAARRGLPHLTHSTNCTRKAH